MSLLKRIAYLDMHDAGSQAREIYQDLKSAPAREVGDILIAGKRSRDGSLLALATDLRDSVKSRHRKKAIAS
jgi:hypothetical protein